MGNTGAVVATGGMLGSNMGVLMVEDHEGGRPGMRDGMLATGMVALLATNEGGGAEKIGTEAQGWL